MINEYVCKPTGKVSLIFHKNGRFNSDVGSIVGGEIINTIGDCNSILPDSSMILANRMANKNVHIDHIEIYYKDNEESTEESANSPLIVHFDASISDEPYAIDYDGDKCNIESEELESINGVYLIKGLAFCATTDSLPPSCVITKLNLCAVDENNKCVRFSEKTNISAWSLPPDVLVTVLWKITF